LEFDVVLLTVFTLSFFIQLAYHWLIFGRLAFYKASPKSNINLPVSVVIVAHNDYYNLLNSLELILKQNYFDFEVVVVNDNSDDETSFYLNELNKIYSHLKVVQIDQDLNFFSGKKFPLSLGIKSAGNDTILLTDASSHVSSDSWINSMQKAFQNKTQIVLGYAPYKSESGLLNKLIRFDNFMNALHYLSFALLHSPITGVGRNLAYSKRMFYEKMGFTSHYTISSGEDSLFINQAANKTNTAICIAPESFIYSEAVKNLSHWLKQKKLTQYTSSLFKAKHRFFLNLYPVSLFLFYSIAIILLALNNWLIVVLVLFLVRLSSFILVQKSALHKLKEQKLLLISPILELLLYTVQGLIRALSIFNTKNKWK